MATIGIDVGTSGTKVLLLDSSGEIQTTVTVEYDAQSPHPMWSEQDPDIWWRALCDGLRKVLRETGTSSRQIRGIGFSGQMVGLVALDESHRVIRPCILWNDQRSVEVAERLTEQLGEERILQETGNPLFPTFVAPKLVWMREFEPENFARIRHVMFPKDYMVLKLTGNLVTDVSDASGSCLFHMQKRRWSQWMLDQMDLPAAWLPLCLESEDVAGEVTAAAADQTGLEAGTPVVIGGGDQPVQAIGNGIVRPGRCSVTIGTSGVVFTQGAEYVRHPDGLLHAFCHSIRNQWFLMGVMLSAGGSFQWLRNLLREVGPVDYEALGQMAATISPGANGLFFLPYLTGERCPHPDPHARGGWIGLTQRHSLSHLTRSVMEGITFGLNDSVRMMRDMGLPVDEVYASGGAAKSAFWRQLMANVFGVPVLTTNVAEVGAFGAALLAAGGGRVFASTTEAVDQVVRVTGRVEPDAQAVTAYGDIHLLYRELYPALRELFPRLGRLDMGASCPPPQKERE